MASMPLGRSLAVFIINTAGYSLRQVQLDCRVRGLGRNRIPSFCHRRDINQ
jgi:hypothetical protein